MYFAKLLKTTIYFSSRTKFTHRHTTTSATTAIIFVAEKDTCINSVIKYFSCANAHPNVIIMFSPWTECHNNFSRKLCQLQTFNEIFVSPKCKCLMLLILFPLVCLAVYLNWTYIQFRNVVIIKIPTTTNNEIQKKKKTNSQNNQTKQIRWNIREKCWWCATRIEICLLPLISMHFSPNKIIDLTAKLCTFILQKSLHFFRALC